MEGSGGMGGAEMSETLSTGSQPGPSQVREVDGDVGLAHDSPYDVDADKTEDEDVPLGRQQHERWRQYGIRLGLNHRRPPKPDPLLQVPSVGVGENGG